MNEVPLRSVSEERVLGDGTEAVRDGRTGHLSSSSFLGFFPIFSADPTRYVPSGVMA